jgi:short-subunit dehydrogenase
MRVRGRSALVTGASSGIGAATADALHAAGARLLLTGTDTTRLAEVAARTGGTPLPADLTDAAGLDRVCQAATEVDLLVHSAGRGWAGELTGMPAERVAELSALNLVAPIRLTAAAVPAMRARGRGHLVFVSSIATVGVRGEAVYAASKAGLRAFATSVRYEVAADGLGVTTVFPGAVATPFFERRGLPYDRRFPRPVPPEAVAAALLRAVQRDVAEVFVPGWLTVPARINGALPGLFHRLAARFG